MTTRKAQGATLDKAVLWFDLWKEASRGYAYVGASLGCYGSKAMEVMPVKQYKFFFNRYLYVLKVTKIT